MCSTRNKETPCQLNITVKFPSLRDKEKILKSSIHKQLVHIQKTGNVNVILPNNTIKARSQWSNSFKF